MTPDDYQRAFDGERVQQYPVIDAFQAECGVALGRGKLEAAARVLACPVKTNPPNWQHGRVIYSAARRYLSGVTGKVRALDIGTAKGFSALCLRWAIDDAGDDGTGEVVSVDVIEPTDKVKRNTVAECDGYKSLYETLEPWHEAMRIKFKRMTGIEALGGSTLRLNICFVDGKHNYDAVKQETALLAARQQPGDLAIFDDTQIEGVAKAVSEAEKWWDFTYLQPLSSRRYAVGLRRG